MADASRLEPAQAIRLAAWLSPSFPIGAFSYSHGLERAIEAGRIGDEPSLLVWLRECLAFGTGRSEAALFRAGWHAAPHADAFIRVAELGQALRPSAELALESEAQGAAFLKTVREAWPLPALDRLAESMHAHGVVPVLPAIVGATCRLHGMPREGALGLYLHAFLANLVSAGVRLIPLGQSAGQRLIAAVEADVLADLSAGGPDADDACALEAALDAVGSACPILEIFSMQHETQYTRLFRS